MTDNPEVRAKIAEWQRKYNIPDGDPAMALIELLNIYGYRTGSSPRSAAPAESERSAPETASAAPAVLDDAAVGQIRTQLLPLIERIGFQNQELKNKLDGMALDTFSEQIGTYHEGIDYCTKKLDVVKKEADALAIQITKVAGSINPITRTAVIVLMLVSGVIGYVIAVAIS